MIEEEELTYLIFTVIQWIWGLPQTLIGAVIYIAHLNRPHFGFCGACVTLWEKENSLSLGKFIFLSEDSYKQKSNFSELNKKREGKQSIEIKDAGFMLLHEYGHCIQSLVLGPLYLIIIGLPSTVWCNLPAFQKRRKKKDISYYDFLPEKNANNLSRKFISKG